MVNRSLRSGFRGRRERGAALIVTVLLFALIGVTALLAVARGSESEADKERRTSEALALAKEALIGFAAGVALTGSERPGHLPCPDVDNDGSADPPCSTAALRLGRLPWKTLGLPDLRDGDGERLWYAVSTNFKNNPPLTCAVPPPGSAPFPHNFGCLNSDTRGTITVKDASSTVVHDGAEGIATPADPYPFATTGAIAVIIAPGKVLTREGAISTQDRTLSGAAVNNPVNYLDVALGEDNADFADGGTNGFISGPVFDANRRLLVNDRIAVLTYQDLMPLLERRVAREVAACLDQYAGSSHGLYPWAADVSASSLNDFSDASGRLAGRIPSTFVNSSNDSGCPGAASCMASTWAGACTLVQSWWLNWRHHVFYALADAYKPVTSATTPTPSCGSCLTVNRAAPNPAVFLQKYVVMVAGKSLVAVAGGQPRAGIGDRANPINYLEGDNVFLSPPPVDSTFATLAAGSTFDDMVVYK